MKRSFVTILIHLQVETIGDAYCVAGGLERRSLYHAQRTAWMALKMMAIAKTETSHDGSVIRVGIRYFMNGFVMWTHIS